MKIQIMKFINGKTFKVRESHTMEYLINWEQSVVSDVFCFQNSTALREMSFETPSPIPFEGLGIHKISICLWKIMFIGGEIQPHSKDYLIDSNRWEFVFASANLLYILYNKKCKALKKTLGGSLD